jgi:high affinity Mn2+ porin
MFAPLRMIVILAAVLPAGLPAESLAQDPVSAGGNGWGQAPPVTAYLAEVDRPDPSVPAQYPVLQGVTAQPNLVIPGQTPQGNLSTSPPGKTETGKPETTSDVGGKTSDVKDQTEKKDDEKRDDEKKEDKPFEEQRLNYYGQTTVITQHNDSFHSPYQGPNSFLSQEETATSATATLMLGGKLWKGGELYFDPEIACGRGLSDVFGMPAFPNGDITRVGRLEPTPYVARLYASQTIGFGGETENIAAGPNQLAVTKDISRFTFTVGKFALTDFFDNNAYAHDPRSQFMNWALMYNAAWDYAADVRGYTLGGVCELNQKDWALRYGITAEPLVANGSDYDMDFGVAHGQQVELEERYKINDRPGKLRLMTYWNRANMGNYRESIAQGLAAGTTPDITASRNYEHVKYGFLVNIEQEINDDLGAFCRLGWDDGQSETWAFTECDRTAACGILLKGASWHRPQDQIGLGIVIDGISSSHAAYLAAGGLGYELGDGKLNYNPEMVLETYYRFELKKDAIWVTPDFQFIADPGYNADRGPVEVFGLRVHAEF